MKILEKDYLAWKKSIFTAQLWAGALEDRMLSASHETWLAINDVVHGMVKYGLHPNDDEEMY